MESFNEKRIKQLKEIREKVLQGGGEKKIAIQHEMGKLSARERIDYLLEKSLCA
mgnify:CR=1 FL=1